MRLYIEGVCYCSNNIEKVIEVYDEKGPISSLNEFKDKDII